MRTAFLIFLLMPAAALAQRPAADTARAADLVVTATRTPWSRDAIPASTTVLSGDELRSRGVRLVSDALREVPGFMLVRTGSYGAVTSAFLRGGESDFVKVLVDGVPLNTPGGALNLSDLSLDNIDRIEIVRGPGSVLYGADAMSGVVQLFTRQGSGALHGNASAGGGTFGNREATGQVAAGQGSWQLSAAGAQFESDGIYDFNNDYRNTVASTRVGWAPDQATALAVTARYGDVRAAFPTDGSGVPTDRNQFTTEETLLLGLETRRALTPGVTAVVQGFARRLQADAHNRPDSPADSVGFGFDSDRASRTWRRGGEARLDWDLLPATRLSIGGGVEREEEDQTSRTVSNFGFGVFEEDDTFDADRTTWHGLAQLLVEPVRSLAIQAGVRVDDNSAFGTFTTARIGATLRIDRASRLWFATGTAFKAPTFSELFAQSAFEVGNPDLDPERTRNIEVGLERRFLGDDLVVSATAFSQQFRDLIQFVSALPGEPTYANLQGVDAEGIEAAVTIRPVRRLQVRAHWTSLRTAVTDTGAVSSVTFTEGGSLLRRPGRSGGVTATLALPRFTAAATVTRVGRRDDADFRNFPAARVTLPSYTLVDASLVLPLLGAGQATGGFDLTLRAENLFDESFDQVVGFPGRGRTILGGARYRF
ncbi:MAG: hypothetical protein CVV20_02260 [Gemmatimonadetes bacterium HGW-Gemmatimonadetes-1]|nr:MAG: hypothetical protein CVV20_02260 [Gemmatimonadetes bacterium HGW-Gemmatimonadetes-1]